MKILETLTKSSSDSYSFFQNDENEFFFLSKKLCIHMCHKCVLRQTFTEFASAVVAKQPILPKRFMGNVRGIKLLLATQIQVVFVTCLAEYHTIVTCEHVVQSFGCTVNRQVHYALYVV